MVGARVVVLLQKEEKWPFFEGCPVGRGGVPTGAGLVDGGLDGSSKVGCRRVGGESKRASVPEG